jgi:hypothetical protein
MPTVPGRLSPAQAKQKAAPGQKAEKKGFFQRIFGIFGSKKKPPDQPPSGPQGDHRP